MTIAIERGICLDKVIRAMDGQTEIRKKKIATHLVTEFLISLFSSGFFELLFQCLVSGYMSQASIPNRVYVPSISPSIAAAMNQCISAEVIFMELY